MQRESGIRKFDKNEIEALKVIECLKKPGLEIKDIRQFMQWCMKGSETYPMRRGLFLKQEDMPEEIRRVYENSHSELK